MDKVKNNLIDYSIKAMKGVAICAVVLIHTNAPGEECQIGSFNNNYSIIFRQFVNFAVPLFFFISGYLSYCSGDGNVRREDYYKKRFLRLGIPYVIWSCIGIALFHNFYDFNAYDIFIALITGQAIGILYFVVVLFQLTLLTPFIHKYIHRPTFVWINFLITPISLATMYVLRIRYEIQISFPTYALPFCIWHFFYFWGIYVKVNMDSTFFKKWLLLSMFAYILAILFSVLESHILIHKYEFFGFALSQIKMSSFVMSFFLINVLMGIKDLLTELKSLQIIGEMSFGIYFLHSFFLRFVFKFLPETSLWQYQPFVSISMAFLAIMVSMLTIYIVRKIVGYRISTIYLGL